MKSVLQIFFLFMCLLVVMSLWMAQREPLAIAPSTERATPYAEELGENYKLRILQNKCYRRYGRQATRLIVQLVI